jgi:hypothetical protein
MTNISEKDAKARYALNDKAVKLAKQSASALQEAAASGMFLLIQGNGEYLNDLYQKLAIEVPNMAESLRKHFALQVLDRFGKGGVRKAEDETVWLKRPTPFIKFGKLPDGKLGFALVSVKDNKALNPQQIKDIKAARAEIRAAGEDALNFVWKDREREQREAEAFRLEDVQKAATNLLVKVAGSANVNGFGKNQLNALAKGFGLSDKNIGKILGSYNDGKPEAPDESEEESETIEELIPASNVKSHETMPETAAAH